MLSGTRAWGVVPEDRFGIGVYDVAQMSERTVHHPLLVAPPVAPIMVVVATVGVACTAVSAVVSGAVVASLFAALLPAAAAAVVDRAEGRLPDGLVAGTAAVPVVLVVFGIVGWPGTLVGAAVTLGPLLAVHLVSPAVIGFGDVKLAAALGGVLGVIDWRGGIAALAIGSGCALLTAAATRRRAVPLGPGLVAGACVVLVALLALGWEVPSWR
jgi:leader peptidase (prepilin peptidase) / N-methyltransferase